MMRVQENQIARSFRRTCHSGTLLELLAKSGEPPAHKLQLASYLALNIDDSCQQSCVDDLPNTVNAPCVNRDRHVGPGYSQSKLTIDIVIHVCKNNLCKAMSRNKKPTIKQLELYLQDLDDFDEPKIELEQYATPPHIAALLLNAIDQTHDDIEGKFVCDLGCGTGRLAIGSVMCGARMVYGFDKDHEALMGALNNFNETFNDDEDDSETGLYQACTNFNLIQADIIGDEFWQPWQGAFDTVIMNPPFGTKQHVGLDMIFLRRAIDISRGTVYSLHKTSTRDFIQSKAVQWGVKAKPIAQIRYNLENTYKFHKRKSVDIEVDLWRLRC